MDIAAQGRAAATVSFGRAPGCEAGYKQVTFDLSTGEHVLDVSGNLDADVALVVERVVS